MTYDEWINRTKAGWNKPRSGKLKALDLALKKYLAVPSTERLRALDRALTAWKDSKPDWKTSIRNRDGAVTELTEFVAQKLGYNQIHAPVVQEVLTKSQTLLQNQENSEYQVTAKVKQKQVYQPPWTVKTSVIPWTVNMGFIKRGTVVNVNVRILAKFGNHAVTDEIKRTWKTHIESDWNCATIIEKNRHRDLIFNLIWVEPGDPKPYYEVCVDSPPPKDLTGLSRDEVADYYRESTIHMGKWAWTDRQAVVHEFGHMLGCPDEYFTVEFTGMGHVFDDAIYNQPPFTTNSIMNNTKKQGRLFDRHFNFVRKAYNAWQKCIPAAEIRILRNIGPSEQEETQQWLRANIMSRRQAMGYDDD
jgi:hypothetical protein